MVHSGTENTDDDIDIPSRIVEFIQGNKNVKLAAKNFLDAKGITYKDLENVKDVEDIIKLLTGKEAMDFLKTIANSLSPDQNETIFGPVSKNPIIIQKADTLGKNIAIGVTSVIAGGILGGAIGANFGAISAGLGVAGGGLLASAPFIAIGILAIVAVAAIGFALFSLYQNRAEIGKQIKDAGKEVMRSLKNFIDRLSTEPSNAVDYVSNCYKNNATNNTRIAKGDLLEDDAAFIKQYLLNKDGFKALENFINAEAAEGRKIKLKDTDIEFTVESLERLKEKGDSKLDRDKDGFIEELSKFQLIMSGANEHIRKKVEAEQDKIHKDKKLETPLPSSALYPGSIANTELLKEVKEEKRNVLKDLLREVSQLEDKFRTGEDGLYKLLKKDPVLLDDKILGNLEGNDSTQLKTVAVVLAGLNEDQIKKFRDTVSTLKEKQLQPRTGMDGVELTSVKPLEHKK